MPTKFTEHTFHEHLQAVKLDDMHPEIIAENFPPAIHNFPNLILYGPKGAGKYSQALKIISKYSASDLKYEKRIELSLNKKKDDERSKRNDDSANNSSSDKNAAILYKKSDIHYEIDLSLQSTVAKRVWSDLIAEINENCSRITIVICRDFNKVHNELLAVMFSYMSKNIRLILLAENVAFIPIALRTKFQLVRVGMVDRMPERRMQFTRSTFFNNVIPVDVGAKNMVPIFASMKEKEMASATQGILSNIKPGSINVRDVAYNFITYNIDLFDIIRDINVLKIKNILTTIKHYNHNYKPIFHLEYIFLSVAGGTMQTPVEDVAIVNKS